MAEKSKCEKCGGDLPNMRNHIGRPRLYCSSNCRRWIETEIRRTKRQIARLRVLADTLRSAIAQGDQTFFLGWGRPLEALPAVEARLAEMEKPIEGRR